jgi:hypothetical protein
MLALGGAAPDRQGGTTLVQFEHCHGVVERHGRDEPPAHVRAPDASSARQRAAEDAGGAGAEELDDASLARFQRIPERRADDLEDAALLLHELAEGPESPGTISFIGGDVHTAYVAEVTLSEQQRSRVFQIVCSPFRNPLEPRERRVVKLFSTRAAGIFCRALARTAGVRRPDVSWQLVTPVTFDNSVAVLDLDERRASLTIRRSAPEREHQWPLELLYERDLTPER